MTHSPLQIKLPSLIHRIGREQVRRVQQQAAEHNYQLKRIRRSRNWQMLGQLEALETLVEHLKQPSPNELSYLINKLSDAVQSEQDKRQPKQQRLAALIQQQPNITVAKLAELANCSLSEARAARFMQQEL